MYYVQSVVCDYGVFDKKDKLVLILNSRRIALEIAKLLDEDEAYVLSNIYI